MWIPHFIKNWRFHNAIKDMIFFIADPDYYTDLERERYQPFLLSLRTKDINEVSTEEALKLRDIQELIHEREK